MPDDGNQHTESPGNQSEHDQRAAGGEQNGDGSSLTTFNRRRFIKAATAAGAAGASLPFASKSVSASHIAKVNIWHGTMNHEWKEAHMPNQYLFDDPQVVVTGPPSHFGPQPGHWRIAGVGRDTFFGKFVEWDYLNGSHLTEESLALHLPTGKFDTDDGTAMATKVIKDSGYDWNFVDLPEGHLGEDPVVFTDVNTENGGEAVVTRNKDVYDWGFDVKMQEQENKNDDGDGDGGVEPGHLEEEIGVMAIEPSSGYIDGNPYEAWHLYDVTNEWDTIYFDQEYLNPVFIADIQTYDGSDTCGLRHKNFRRDRVEVKIEEERSKDDEVWHTTEDLGYMVVDKRELSPGERLNAHSEDTYITTNKTYSADMSWCIDLVDYDSDTNDWWFGVYGLFNNFYKYDGVLPWNNSHQSVTFTARFKENSPKNDTNLGFWKDATDLTRIRGLRGTDWSNWYYDEKGNAYTLSETKDSIDGTTFDDNNLPLWLNGAAFLGGVGASVISGGAPLVAGALGVFSNAVGGIGLLDQMSEGSDDGDSNTDEYTDFIEQNWCYGYGDRMALTAYSM